MVIVIVLLVAISAALFYYSFNSAYRMGRRHEREFHEARRDSIPQALGLYVYALNEALPWKILKIQRGYPDEGPEYATATLVHPVRTR